MDYRGHLQLKAKECYFYVLMRKSNEEHHNWSNAQVFAGSPVSVCAHADVRVGEYVSLHRK